MSRLPQSLTPKQKALDINLDHSIYGTFAEIGAGQETARHFFRAGGASRTIAKAMSAYDKDFSDAIYGKEPDGRYVTQNRVRKMLKYESALIEERLNQSKDPDRKYFSYANTVATINYKRTYQGQGWVGIRFQAQIASDYNEIVLHIEFKENDANFQQETLGKLGVNLIYGAFRFSDNPRKLIRSLYDDIALDKLVIDMIDFKGPEFEYVDNRLMSLELVRNGMTDAVIFNSSARNMLAADLLYHQNIFAIRGSFRPVTLVNTDMLEKGLKMFFADTGVGPYKSRVIFEITLNTLSTAGDIDERDFLDRADVLAKLGYNVMISNFSQYHRMVDYFTRYTDGKIGLTMGIVNVLDAFNEDFYKDLSGGILEAFGKLFKRDTHVYLYPHKDPESGELINSDNIKVALNLKDLYKYFKKNQVIVDIKDYNPEYLKIYSQEIVKQIASNQTGWEEHLPEGVADMIKERGMFGYKELISK